MSRDQEHGDLKDPIIFPKFAFMFILMNPVFFREIIAFPSSLEFQHSLIFHLKGACASCLKSWVPKEFLRRNFLSCTTKRKLPKHSWHPHGVEHSFVGMGKSGMWDSEGKGGKQRKV